MHFLVWQYISVWENILNMGIVYLVYLEEIELKSLDNEHKFIGLYETV